MLISCKLDLHFQRPVIRLPSLKGARALIDTGARFSVWTFSKNQLEYLGGINQNYTVPFGGFGGATQGMLYTLDFWLDKLLIKNMPVVVEANVSLKCPLIISTTAFDGFKYSVDTHRKVFEIDTFSNQLVKPLAYSILANGSISVYAQDDFNV